MTIDKIILFGSSGMLGRYIYSYFKTKINIINIEYKITNNNFEVLEQMLVNNHIDENTCIINCIGLIPQRIYQNENKTFFLINSIFPSILWNICKKYKAKMIQPSTDCVFSGKKGNYLETDIHDETSYYGMSKSLGEPYDCTIIRTSIIGLELMNKKSFLEWVISNKNNEINGFTNHYWNGITCLEYCKVIEKIIHQNIFWCGIRHIYSPTSKSKYELASIINDIFNLNMNIIPVETNDKIDKTLLSIYNNNDIFEIPELYNQINELKDFKLFKE
jgi:dTDP-4-dehydrorhamnose reductase